MCSSPALRVWSLVLGLLTSLPIWVHAERPVQIRFVDSATGRAVQPQTVESKAALLSHTDRHLDAGVSPSGRTALPLERGKHMITVDAVGYQPMSGEFDMSLDNPYAIVFQLDPL